ncbi:MAG TPA: vWA domain-containing protein, partial [Aquella sp.]|nr:vWA domain-containing protein [Aquella sp.]
KSHYNSLIAYEEQKSNNAKNNKRHIYFLLDISHSMFAWYNADPLLNNVSFTRGENKMIDGTIVCVKECDNKYEQILDKARFLYKCLNNITNIITYIQKMNTNHAKTYVTSFTTFAKSINTVMKFEELDILKKYIETQSIKSYRTYDNENTHVYDALRTAINIVNDEGNMGTTTFVLCTDGIDCKSEMSLDQIIDLIKKMKSVNIIIITIDLKSNQINDFQKIINAAKFGKLIQVDGDISKCGFNNINDAFTKTKELIISESYIQQPIDIREKFNF